MAAVRWSEGSPPPPHSPSLDKHVLTEQLHTNPLGEILYFVPQAADKWNSYRTCEHDLQQMAMQKSISMFNATRSHEAVGVMVYAIKAPCRDTKKRRKWLQMCLSADFVDFTFEIMKSMGLVSQVAG